MKKILTSLLATCLFTTTVAYATLQTSPQQQATMSIQIIKQELNLTKESFKSVQLVNLPNDGYAVEVELTSKAAELMHSLTASNIQRRINLVWQNHIINSAIIQSPLGDKFQITGFN